MRYDVKIIPKKFNKASSHGKVYNNLSAVALLELIGKKLSLENNERLKIIITVANEK